ncbi:MAG TPA: FAD-dependent oxidoreductase, partial [Chloroflexota bacterium]|nr:FAD-dependent oxidoreductase [Chloroflexota bacterium]
MTETIECELAVYGATPGGILAAVTAARYGRRVTLCTAQSHLGGLLSSGLSIANIRYLQVHGGPFAAFARAVEAHYVAAHGPDGAAVGECRGGTWWEPHVAEAVFEALLAAAPGVRLLRGVRLEAARTAGGRV